MNIGRIKALCWISVLALGAYLGWDVFEFITVGKSQLKNISRDEQTAALNVPEVVMEKRSIVPYDSVRSLFHELNWTGKQKVVEVPKGPDKPEEVKQPKKPIRELLTVVLINFSSEPKWSNASVHYKANADEGLMRVTRDDVLFIGDKLPGKYRFVTLSAITPDYVEFSFETPEGEEPRESEKLFPPEYQSDKKKGVGIARVDADGIVMVPDQDNLIPIDPNRPKFNLQHTWERRTNQFVIGTEDAATFGRDYTHILSSEVQTSSHVDPTTGRRAGIRIDRVSPDSLVSSHGLKAGDIIKSINGDTVTSTQEAISYVKNNAELTTHWVAVVERQGKDITLTYDYSPQN